MRRLRRRGPREVRLFEDETDLLLLPPLRAAWGRRGEAREVRLSGANARRVVFGALNIDTGRRLFLARKRQRAEDFCEFLRLARRAYRSWDLLMLLDEDSSHTAGASQDTAWELDIELVWLPKRCPQLNGLERLWGHGKDHVCANQQGQGIDAEAGRFIRYLSGLPNREALHQGGLLSDDWWLRNV